MKPKLYDRNMNFISVLNEASTIGYKRVHNDLFTGSFLLPVYSPDNDLCDTHYIVDIFDGEISKGKYRILDEPDAILTGDSSYIQYDCEHVIAFLLNVAIPGYLELGGTGVNTRAVIEYLLNLQTVRRWQLGQCDFNYFFQYSWENTNVMEALFSIPKCFAEDYHWTYNTDTYPWTINLIRQDASRKCEIRRKRNMQQIRRSKDSSALCTRLYCLGNGEGINQVNIKGVNPTGKAYIEADTVETYGVLESHYIDLSITDPATLMANGMTMLNEIKVPRYTYTAKAVDLNRITGDQWDLFDEGKYVHLIDESIGADLDTMIISVEKKDVEGDPLDTEIVISNKQSDISSTIENLARRTAITAQYSQGATNLYAQQMADNADETHPAVMRFYVPDNCAKINRILLSWKYEHFRAYETGSASGGGSTSSSGGGGSVTSRSGGNSAVTSADNGNVSLAFIGLTGSGGGEDTGGAYAEYGISHTHKGPSHKHDMGHGHVLPLHSHKVKIPSHTHLVDVPNHTHELPQHVHGIIYGIYEGGIASSATVKVDGTTVPDSAVKNNDFDVIPFLSKDSNGKITRGVWHSVEIIPTSLTRIEANMFVQTFVTSYVGGNY